MATQPLTATTTAASILSRHCIQHYLIFLLLLLLPFMARADHAYVEGDYVYLPVVEDYPHNSSLKLRILRGTFPLEFAVEHIGDAEGPVCLSSAWFDGSLLIVPEVWINDVSYWAELRELSNARFRLEFVIPNSVSDPSTGGTYHHEDWEYMSGEARDIGIGADVRCG